jgi:acetyl esterase/lipase
VSGACSRTMTATPPHHLRPESRLAELLDHPALEGIAARLLPWDGRRYDPDMRLSDLGSLLPYHTHVDPKTTVAAINRIIDDARSGERVFYDLQDGVRRDGGAAEQGLFFFRGRPRAPFSVIAPGGGFSYVASFHDGFPYAAAINAEGYNAFVLKYRVGLGGRAATEDLAAAIAHILRNAESLGVGTQGYSLWGSSAGARMAAAIASYGVAGFGGGEHPGPAAVVMAYTAHADHGPKEPPTFAVVGDRDRISSPQVMERRISALRRIGTQVEYHKYPRLGHGFGPGVGTSAEGWLDKAVRFWERAMGTVHEP